MEKTEEKTNSVNLFAKFKNWRKNVVEDSSAPSYYSQNAIYFLTLFFSTLYGAALLVLNIRKTKPKKAWGYVLVFGILFFIAELVILSLVTSSKPVLFLLFRIMGANILNNIFWKKYIGEVQYQAKKIIIPILIAFLIIALGFPISYFLSYSSFF